MYRSSKAGRRAAVAAYGKPLPKGAEVHHVNGSPLDNWNKNLVVCQDNAYHKLLHARTRAYLASGHAHYRRCSYCGDWDDPIKMQVYNGKAKHGSCFNAYQRMRRRLIKEGSWSTRKERR